MALCALSHPLTSTKRSVPWTCDVCDRQHAAGTTSLFCATCDYDACPGHSASVVARGLPAPQPGAGAASLTAVKAALDAVAGPRGFRCVPVSWEDAQRGTVGGALSCWGGNISDVRLYERTGRLLFTLRTENWNERLGYVSTKDVAVVVGNQVAGGSTPTAITLERYLKGVREYAGYAGVGTESLYDATADTLASIRFQTVFLPVADTTLAKTEFCTEVYNYNTRSDDDPRNLLLLCTPQGTSVQQDGAAAKKVFYHAVDGGGVAHQYWLEAERSEHSVGGAQVETAEEATAAAARGKATAVRIGTRAMGTRFNVQLLIQLPLKQKPVPHPRASYFSYNADNNDDTGIYCQALDDEEECAYVPDLFGTVSESNSAARTGKQAAIGVSNAARVSRGSEEGVFGGVANRAPLRDASQHATITVTMYYTVAGGVPSAEDVRRAVDDLDALYRACPSDKRLVDCGEVTAELTVKAMADIGAKVTQQPYKPAPTAPAVDHGFPV